ncbi:MAG: helix-turn-helix transcriptional regulator [Anaerolineaceae bacterium]|nr:helix-turn-helix transcriptional regulator [Anaerolineaceae bacterium]
MFDTKKIGARIAELRKAKDMTQMELADQMLVSYQAVSNWERGNTMPDIAKLSDLARILGVSIEVLLGSEEQMKIINKVVAKDLEIKLAEVAEVAPVLKPSQVEEALNSNTEEKVNIETLVMLAPFLSSQRLATEAKKAQVEDIADMIPLAPFLEEEALEDFIKAQPSMKKNYKSLIALAPFLSTKRLGAFTREALETEDFDKLIGLAPFLEPEDLDAIALKIFDSGRHAGSLAGLAPFLSSETIGSLASRINPDEQKKYLIALAPFISSGKLAEIARQQMQKGNLKILRAIMPFIDGEDIL